MKRIIFFLWPLIVSLACNAQSRNLEQLQKAKWNTLLKGIDYITIKSQSPNAGKYHSIEIAAKGILDPPMAAIELSFTDYADLKITLAEILKSNLLNSKRGYLRINFYEIRQYGTFTASVYMKDGYDSLMFVSDLTILRTLPIVKEIIYISKETAKLRYLADGNPDWKDILDKNPLPVSVELILDASKCSEESMQNLEKAILEQIPFAVSVNTPIGLIKTYDNQKGRYYFFEYKRK